MIRVLLADDDDAMRDFLARALSRAGYGVEAVDRGTAALALISRYLQYVVAKFLSMLNRVSPVLPGQ